MKRTILLTIIAIAILLASCSSGSTPFPIGDYKDDCCGNRWSFMADGSVTRKTAGGDLVGVIGSYSIDGEQMTISGTNDECGNGEGVFKWSVAEDGFLDFETVEDECLERRLPLIKGLTPLP